MNSKAFKIPSNNEDKDFYPNDCQIDTSLDNDIINFFKSQKNEEDTYYLSKKTKNKKDLSQNPEEHIEKPEKFKKEKKTDNNENEIENGIFDENDDDEDEDENDYNEELNEDEEEGGEESSSSSELIYSTFPDNIEITKKSIYEKMHINTNLINAVVDEYLKTKNKFLKELNKDSNNEDVQEDEDGKFIISPKEFSKYDLPKDNFIKKNILPYKSNEYLMKNINKCFKVMKNSNKTNKEQLNKVSEWLYTFLLFLEMPISPDNSADLYSINKYIYNNFMKTTELKIIFIIICEIFKQILVL